MKINSVCIVESITVTMTSGSHGLDERNDFLATTGFSSGDGGETGLIISILELIALGGVPGT